LTDKKGGVKAKRWGGGGKNRSQKKRWGKPRFGGGGVGAQTLRGGGTSGVGEKKWMEGGGRVGYPGTSLSAPPFQGRNKKGQASAV